MHSVLEKKKQILFYNSMGKIISDLFLEGKYIFPSSHTIFFQGN